VAAKLTANTETLRSKDQDVPIFSIATITPSAKQDPTSDKLFELLWKWTQAEAKGAEPAAPPLPKGEALVARDPNALPPLDDIANDGVVNTNRQVVGRFAGLALGDHGDVLGRYRRVDALDGKLLDPGLLTSGANFNDDEFFKLLRLIAKGIAEVIRGASR
jgi:hypothetical protein